MAITSSLTPKEFGKKIRAARLKNDLTQQQLAQLVGVSKGAISQWENGKIDSLKTANLMGLVAALQLDATEMFAQLSQGVMEDHAKYGADEVPPSRRALLQAYGRLPDDIRKPIRLLIETLDAALNPRHAEAERRLAESSAKIRAAHAKKVVTPR